MPKQALRRAIARYKATLMKYSASAALFAGATLVVADTSAHPSRMVVRPAVLALVRPVSVAPRPNSAFGYLSQVAAIGTPPTARPSPAPAWQLANIANPRVDKWVGRFTSSLKSGFTAALARGRAYSDMISRKLAARGMPQELVYLAMIESEFKPAVRSSASAVGLWQFMASTARRFGLNVGGRSDDRTDPSKATDAALTYLAQLHDQFGSWYLAAAAYNAGPGTVSRALRRVTGRSSGEDADFYRIASALPAETRDYVPKLVAAARVGKTFGDF
jgi:membrane-bound lytic murein transglycosylase D